MARDGVYRSQFETGTSNGGLTAHPGGDRWRWESRIFGGAYDDAEPALRPKYGALDLHRRPYGAAPRFGSAHVRLAAHTLERTTFCFPDSVFEPEHFGTATAFALAELAEAADHDLLDDYVEAHVHGVVALSDDVEALVLDPGYRGTDVEARRARSGRPSSGTRATASTSRPCAPTRTTAVLSSSPSASRSPSTVSSRRRPSAPRHARVGTTSRRSSASGTTSRGSGPPPPEPRRRARGPSRTLECAVPYARNWALDAWCVTTVVTTVVTEGRGASTRSRSGTAGRPRRAPPAAAPSKLPGGRSRRAGRWRRSTRVAPRAPCRESVRRAGATRATGSTTVGPRRTRGDARGHEPQQPAERHTPTDRQVERQRRGPDVPPATRRRSR